MFSKVRNMSQTPGVAYIAENLIRSTPYSWLQGHPTRRRSSKRNRLEHFY